MALTKQELEDCRNYKRRLDMSKNVYGQIALNLAATKKRQEDDKNSALRRHIEADDKTEENPILRNYK